MHPASNAAQRNKSAFTMTSVREPSSETNIPENDISDSVHTYAVATPANLDTIPTVVAQLPSGENDVEQQNGSSSSIPLAVAMAIRGEVDQQPAHQPSVSNVGDTRKSKYRRAGLIVLVGLLVLVVTVFVLDYGNEEPLATFIYHEYPELTLTKTIPCQRTNTSNNSCQWKQIGSDLVGPTVGDFFGATLRLGGTANGSRFSVTAPLYGMNQGLTRVYDIVENRESNSTNVTTTQYAFQQVAKSFVGKYDNDAQKGIIADDGYHLIMSSVDASLDGQPNIGHFGSFQLSPESGNFEMYGNELYGQSSQDDFGAAVVNRDGTVVAISDIQYDLEEDEGIITNAGVVVLFSYDKTTNTWKSLGQKIGGSSTDEYWGRKTALSGDGYTVVIGSRNFDDNKGKVQAYRLDQDTQEWIESGQAIIGKTTGEGVGREVELSADGKVLAVTNDFISSILTGLNKTGNVQVFQYNNGTLSWEQLGSTIMSDLQTQSDFGYQLRMSDDGMRLAISEAKYSPSDELSSAGRVRVYDYVQEEQDWVLVDDVVGQRNCDFVGAGFDLCPDGSRLIGEYCQHQRSCA